MLDKFLEIIKKIASSRIIPICILFGVLFLILIFRMFTLQIVNATDNAFVVTSSSEYKQEKTKYTSSTRGNIYDSKGNLLAYNTISYSIVMSNSALLTTNAEKNRMIYRLLSILDAHGITPELEFMIEQDEKGELIFNVSGNALLRFKKNAYGLRSINDLDEEQLNATAEDVFNFLRYGKKNVSSMFNISDEYSIEDTLRIMKIRYTLFTLVPQYSTFTLAQDVDEAVIAAILENSAELPGVEIEQHTARVYNDSIFFAHILGYTGTVNETELEALNEGLETPMYYASDTIGKTGIEKTLDETLRGTKGEITMTLNNSGKVLANTVISEPVVGDDVYLTIDREFQIACYHILENNISAILRSKIVNSMSYGSKGKYASGITIPIYEVYNAFINNQLLDTNHFSAEDATETERSVYSRFSAKKEDVLNTLSGIIDYNQVKVNSAYSEETEGYIDYVYQTLKNTGLLMADVMTDKAQAYKDYVADEISISKFIREAINNGWIDLSVLQVGDSFRDTEELFVMIKNELLETLKTDKAFDKKIYRNLIFNYKISGKELCILLYDQGVLEYNESDYSKLKNGRITPYNFVMEKLENLEITPGMLALEPCSGSIVVTDVKTGDTLALVTYPSYDANKLANKIDWDYYSTLMSNNSTPLINRPTQQATTTGSTFKPLMALAGFGENIVTPSTRIKDAGIFELIDPSPKCWYYPSSHGNITASEAIRHSCNYYFYTIGYEMSLNENGEYSDSQGISTIQEYASLFGFNEKSGIELPESSPVISNTDAVRTAIGYYHNFTPVQIARYATAVANKGTLYDLTLIDRIYDKKLNSMIDYQAVVSKQIDQFTPSEWKAVHEGMWAVVNSASGLRSIYSDLGVTVAGKTGTAQVSLTHPSHGLFISFAPYEDPEICVTVVVPNGYASANSAKIAREVYGLYFNDENKEELLSGDMTKTNVTNVNISD